MGSSRAGDGARLALRLVRRLPPMLREPIGPGEARRIREESLAGREGAFLATLRRAAFEQPASPYRRLLEHAGCEPGDAERLVAERGLEGALGELAGAGVYLTVDELKGRRPVARGSASFDCGPDAVRNPLSSFHLAVRSGGTRSPGTPVLMDASFLRACGAATRAFLDAWGDDGWRKAIWETPGGGARFRLLKYGSFGAMPERWFSQADPAAPELDPVFRWSERATRWAARLGGVRVPRPEHVSLEDPLPIARWMAGVLAEGGRPYLFTFPSSAVRLCRAAAEAGVGLEGACLLVGGEPVTSGRLAAIGASGATALPRYGSMETGPVGYGCLAPEAPDDAHLLHDLNTLVTAPASVRAAAGMPERAVLVTALHPASPFVLLNVSMGDEATLARRSCGCPVEALGYPVHLTAVRSFEKLTIAGVTLLDTDVIHVLEEILPAEIGGAPTDYQLVEREEQPGSVRVRLLVHPRLGELDDERVRAAFLGAFTGGRGTGPIAGQLWRDADPLRVVREPPQATGAGKIQHLHREPPASP